MARLIFQESKALDVAVKRLLRQHSLYHLIEPHTMGNMVYYVVEGPTESINAFHQDYGSVLEQYNRQLAKANKWLWLRRILMRSRL